MDGHQEAQTKIGTLLVIGFILFYISASIVHDLGWAYLIRLRAFKRWILRGVMATDKESWLHAQLASACHGDMKIAGGSQHMLCLPRHMNR